MEPTTTTSELIKNSFEENLWKGIFNGIEMLLQPDVLKWIILIIAISIFFNVLTKYVKKKKNRK